MQIAYKPVTGCPIHVCSLPDAERSERVTLCAPDLPIEGLRAIPLKGHCVFPGHGRAVAPRLSRREGGAVAITAIVLAHE